MKSPWEEPTLGKNLPVGHRHESAAFQLTLDDQRQRRALHPAHGEELVAQPRGGQRDEPGERGSPDKVDVLAGLAGLGQGDGKFGGLGESPVDLFRGQGRITRPRDAL